MRVVSLACSNTEIVAALGLGHTLVGVDDHSDHPPDVVAALPRVGPDLSIDVAAVAALRPDVVLASLTLPGHERVVDALRAAGLPVAAAPDPQSLDDVYRDIRDVGALLGAPDRAEAVVDGMRRHLRPRPPSGVRILVEWWPKPVIVPGRRSWVTDVITLAGGVNPFGERDVRSTPIADAEAVEAAPDVVFVSWCWLPLRRYRPDVVLRRAAWADVPAIRTGAVACVTEAFLGRPGPRLVDGYDALAALIDARRSTP